MSAHNAPHPPGIREYARMLHATGHTWRQISDKTGVPMGTLGRWLKFAENEPRPDATQQIIRENREFNAMVRTAFPAREKTNNKPSFDNRNIMLKRVNMANKKQLELASQ